MGEISAKEMRKLIYHGGVVNVIVEKDFELVRRPLIEPVRDEDGEFIEGSAFDIRAHKVYQPVDGWAYVSDKVPYLSDDLRDFIDVEEVKAVSYKGSETWLLEPGKRYLVESLETVNTPWYLRCIPRQKSTVFRMFANLIYGSAHPGYCGPIVGLIDVSFRGLRLKVDDRVAYVTFSRFDSGATIEDVDLYDKKANWGHGKNIVIPESGRIQK